MLKSACVIFIDSEVAVLAVTFAGHSVYSCAVLALKTLIFPWLSFCNFTRLSGAEIPLYRV